MNQSTLLRHLLHVLWPFALFNTPASAPRVYQFCGSLTLATSHELHLAGAFVPHKFPSNSLRVCPEMAAVPKLAFDHGSTYVSSGYLFSIASVLLYHSATVRLKSQRIIFPELAGVFFESRGSHW
ncbi:hypothetical protein BJ912DRAFT_958792 [Pholiota molesta]|nr:hypothetical protein BJ912DRAFT_958792 [Pholiota molesta]